MGWGLFHTNYSLINIASTGKKVELRMRWSVARWSEWWGGCLKVRLKAARAMMWPRSQTFAKSPLIMENSRSPKSKPSRASSTWGVPYMQNLSNSIASWCVPSMALISLRRLINNLARLSPLWIIIGDLSTHYTLLYMELWHTFWFNKGRWKKPNTFTKVH